MTYQRKTKPAPWLAAFPSQRQPENKSRADQNLRSKKRSRKAQYAIAAKAFIERQQKAGKKCPVLKRIEWGADHISFTITQIHHIRGRLGKLLLDERYWLGVSAAGHRWIHDNPNESRKRGWLAQPGDWNKGEK